MNKETFLNIIGALYDAVETAQSTVRVVPPDDLKTTTEPTHPIGDECRRPQPVNPSLQKSERHDYVAVRAALRDTASQARDAIDIQLSQVSPLYNGVRPNRVRIANAAPFVDDILRMMYEDAQYERSTLSNIIHVMDDYDTEAECIKPDWILTIPRPLLYCFCIKWCYRVDVVTISNPEAKNDLHQLGFCVALSNTFTVRVSFTVENNSVHIRQI